MLNNKLYVDIHVVETVPPSCINRDDAGSPKTAVYGGTVRARVSSQCWKKAVRTMFADILPAEMIGKRTLFVPDLIAEAIRARNPALDADKLARNLLEAAGVKTKADKSDEDETKENKGEIKTDALFFISQSQIDALADLAVKNPDGIFGDKEKKGKNKGNKKKYDETCQAALNAKPAIDVALFGRMVANAPSLNFDAAAQVAHAISTHAVHNEYDYFTAVDDCSPEDNAGAGHLGTVEFNSSTLYRYATVDVTELEGNLGADTALAVRAFVEAFALSMPTGKQNTFANNMLPNAVYVTIRHDRPINLVGAFESPVQTKNGGYVDESIRAFVEHAQSVYDEYLGAPDEAFAVGKALSPLAPTMPLNELLDKVESCVRTHGGQK